MDSAAGATPGASVGMVSVGPWAALFWTKAPNSGDVNGSVWGKLFWTYYNWGADVELYRNTADTGSDVQALVDSAGNVNLFWNRGIGLQTGFLSHSSSWPNFQQPAGGGTLVGASLSPSPTGAIVNGSAQVFYEGADGSLYTGTSGSQLFLTGVAAQMVP
jgi:hypothetical protein